MELKGKLTVIRGGRKVVALKPGRYAAGYNVYLQVTSETAASWIFMAKWSGKRREIGLGSFIGTGRAFTLDREQAQTEAEKIRAMLRAGQDPRVVRAKPATAPTFAAMLDDYLQIKRSGWKGNGTEKQWRDQFAKHCTAFLKLPVDKIDIDAVVTALRPAWHMTVGETLRFRIAAVLDHAEELEHRTGKNPAKWTARLQSRLGADRKLKGATKHAALPYAATAAFMEKLAARKERIALVLAFVIFTAGRANEACKAKWSEIDLDHPVGPRWTVPADRMKMEEEHIVPLSRQAVELLKSLPRDSEWVFPADRNRRKPINSKLFSQLITKPKQMNLAGQATAHGFRSTFRDWAGDLTSFDREAIEFCLSHKVGDNTEDSYRRAKAVQKRADIMQAWADYATGTSNVVQLPVKEVA